MAGAAGTAPEAADAVKGRGRPAQSGSRRRAAAVTAALAAVGLLAGGWWVARQRAAPAPPAPPAPGIRTLDVHLVGRRKGQLQWELQAGRIEMPARGAAVAFRQVRDGAFYREGQLFLRFEGEGGRWDPEAERLFLEGAYVLRHPGGAVLQSRDLVWDAGRQLLVSREAASLSYEQAAAHAPLLEVDVAAGVIRLAGGVVLEDPSAGGLQVRAQAAEYLPGSGEIRLLGPVEMEGEAGP